MPERFRPWHTDGVRYLLRPLTAPQAQPEATVQAAAPVEQQPDSLASPAPLPELWARCLSATGAKAVWTYWELGPDLLAGTSDRLELLRTIVSRLGWSSDHVVFLPLSRHSEGGILPEAGHFRRALAELGAGRVFVFGARALETLIPGRRFAIENFSHDGVTYHVLPGPDEMLPDNRAVKKVAWEALKPITL